MRPKKSLLSLALLSLCSAGSTALAQDPIVPTPPAAVSHGLIETPSPMATVLAASPSHTHAQPIVHETLVGTHKLCTVGDAGFFGSVDYLYYTVRDKNFEFGILGGRNAQDDGARGDVLTMSDDWDNGIRGAIGYRLSCQGPDIQFRYMSFDQLLGETVNGDLRATRVTSDNAEEDDIDNINTLGANTVFPEDLATQAVAVYDLDYDTYDIEIGQSFRFNEFFDLRMHTGARILEMDELEQVVYSGGDFNAPYTARETQSISGAGMYLGGIMDWAFAKNLSINSGINGGLILASHESSYFFSDEDDIANGDGPTLVTESKTRMLPYLELSTGLTATNRIRGINISTSLGYQFVTYMGASESRTFSDMYQEGQNTRVRDNISLDGFFARIGFNY